MVGEMKKRLQRRGARRGFTLVELLIVIIIIGILAGAMMLVAGRSRDSAEASKIISDLRSVKAAALIWLTENPAGLGTSNWTGLEDDPTPINSYLDKPLVKGHHRFLFETGTMTIKNPSTVEGAPEELDVGVWLLGYDLKEIGDEFSAVRPGVTGNLASQAKSVGLYGTKTIDMTATSDTEIGYFQSSNTEVYVIVQ